MYRERWKEDLCPQLQFRNLKAGLPQKHIRNFYEKCWSATAYPYIRNHNFFLRSAISSLQLFKYLAPQLHVRLPAYLQSIANLLTKKS